MLNKKVIVVLGGGVGGLVTANELRRLLPRQHTVVLVEKNPYHAFAPSFLWMMVGDRTPASITRAVRDLVRPDVDVVHEEAVNIDVANRRISTTSQAIPFDYLIVALGAELAPDAIPGLSGEAHSFFSFEGTQKLYPALQNFTHGKIALVVCSLPYKCPGVPHEGAMLIGDFFRKRGLKDSVEVHLYTPESQPMPVAGPQLGEAVKQMLTSKGIAFHPLHKLISVDSQNHTLSFDSKESARYDMLIAIPPHRAPRIVREAGMTNPANGGTGWVPVDRSTLKTKHENVYAIGDIAAISIPGRWKSDVPMMLPKAGVFAHVQAEIVAQRIVDEVNGRTPKAEFCGAGYCMLEAGEGLAGFAFGDFFAEPSPRLELRNIGRAWHLGKVLFEKWWLSPFGIKRSLLRSIINLGGKVMKIPVKA
ncbi:MAG: NAD(P)/FAD-dependent oxidoreductase [Ignavibacteriae bacterium]|nr:NAD(P)/FAD-dependent oxidoreductase [Ignavibacteriota bacterium]